MTPAPIKWLYKPEQKHLIMKTTYLFTIILFVLTASLFGQDSTTYISESDLEQILRNKKTIPDSVINWDYPVQQNGKAYYKGKYLLQKNQRVEFTSWHAYQTWPQEIWLVYNKETGKIEEATKNKTPKTEKSALLIFIPLFLFICFSTAFTIICNLRKTYIPILIIMAIGVTGSATEIYVLSGLMFFFLVIHLIWWVVKNADSDFPQLGKYTLKIINITALTLLQLAICILFTDMYNTPVFVHIGSVAAVAGLALSLVFKQKVKDTTEATT